MIYLHTVVEDVLSEVVLEKVFESFDSKYYPTFFGKKGNTFIRENLIGFNQAARQIPFFILTDLDNHICSPSLINNWFDGTNISAKMLFRVAEKEVESWLLADRLSFSRYFNVPIHQIPNQPDLIRDPKLKLLQLVNIHSRKEIREDIISPFNENKQGPSYNDRLTDFVRRRWNINRASHSSPSLRKTLVRLDEFED